MDDKDAQSAFDYAFLTMHSPPVQSDYSQIIRTADLFCGCGGLSLGAAEACRVLGKRFLSVAAVDKDPVAVRTYKRNFPCSTTYSDEIEKVVDGEIGSEPTIRERIFLKEVGNIDVLLAGPPCQGYSNLNNHTRRKDGRNTLYERVARFTEIAKPKHVLIENVPAAIFGVEGAVKRTIKVIQGLGYAVDSGVVDLTTIGVPQKRKRYIVVASLSKKPSVKATIEKHRVEHVRSVKWAIGDLEDEPSTCIFTTASCLSQANMQRIEYLHQNDLYDLPEHLRPVCHRNGRHSYPSMYGRMKLDEPSQTITSGFQSPGQGRFIHPTRLRTLTPHEAARLQFFPDYFDFSEATTRAALAMMIGNAAPMKLSYVFVLDLLV